jgi:RNA polymerase sigma-70 factor, ECF subfamily
MTKKVVKLFRPRPHGVDIYRDASIAASGPILASGAEATKRVSFEEIYRAWFRPVTRWLPAMGVPRGDVEDVAQEVFMIARARLASFDGEHVAAWLYAISLRTASNHRRLAWVRRLFFCDDDSVRTKPVARETPESLSEQRQLVAIGEQLLADMSDKLRRAFVLFELEGYTGEEIAELEKIPLATVFTRVHNALRQFEQRAARARKEHSGS